MRCALAALLLDGSVVFRRSIGRRGRLNAILVDRVAVRLVPVAGRGTRVSVVSLLAMSGGNIQRKLLSAFCLRKDDDTPDGGILWGWDRLSNRR